MMSSRLGLVALAFACLSLTNSNVVADDPQFEHLRFIQQVGKNLLYRGPEPKENNTFALKQMVAAMDKQHPLPSIYTILDVNLLTTETSDIEMEVAFFKANPKVGSILLWPTYGANTAPYSYSTAVIKERAINISQWMKDDLPTRMVTIRKLLETPVDPPLVIYMHCECGCDRTGEMSISYYMQFMNMTLAQAHKINTDIIGREMETDEKYGMEWYCFHLKYALNYNLTCQED
eukprot:TRINITY_DN2422_c0_g1_i1.p1 TRINITY_DN2422_c0_g1~~TRINITY_DN2422_c0_g1_i1.p1  ORF type:complete len:248 (-),score=55.75 TRINITY_DN2422_c0_g1_i1:89-787(-)